MSGGGVDRSSYESVTPVGSARSSAGGGGGGSGGGGDPCAIVQDAPLNSPNPAVVAALSVGSVLDVAVAGGAPRRILEVRLPGTGVAAGSLTHVGHLQLIACIDAGHAFRAEVIQRTGGSVVVRVERA